MAVNMVGTYECERCGKSVTGTYDTIANVTCETFYECPYCGFVREWAYGSYGPNDTEFGSDSRHLVSKDQ